jgi:hypothetical protein
MHLSSASGEYGRRCIARDPVVTRGQPGRTAHLAGESGISNDNVDALRFYQRRGFRLAALHQGAVDDSRARLKPEIPEIGEHRIPLRNELELELEPRKLPIADRSTGSVVERACQRTVSQRPAAIVLAKNVSALATAIGQRRARRR